MQTVDDIIIILKAYWAKHTAQYTIKTKWKPVAVLLNRPYVAYKIHMPNLHLRLYIVLYKL